jgi:hypothetical protein
VRQTYGSLRESIRQYRGERGATSMRRVIVATKARIVAMTCLAVAVASSAQTLSLNNLEGLRAHKVMIEVSSHNGRAAVHVTDEGEFLGNNEDKLVIVDQVQFRDGVIEVSLAGAPGSHAGEGARGFVGIAFRVAPDASEFEAFYLRPTNGRANDQIRRNHSAQYISYPDYPWYRLREETPGLYESYVDLVPGEWTRVRIEVSGTNARLFVHGAEQPSLIVNDLKLGGERSDAVGLWIGPGTDAYFADLSVNQQ